MDNLSSIVINNDFFENYKTFKDIIKSLKKGYLYIFFCIINGKNLIKFGETERTLRNRIFNYPYEKININNIFGKHCTIPLKRERLIKGYLKKETEYKPSFGSEYYPVESLNLIKILIIIFYNISEEQIGIMYNLYSKKDNNYKLLFKKIKDTVDKISKNPNYKLEYNEITIESTNITTTEDKYKVNMNFVCKYCNKNYNSQSSLNYHQKTTKFCLQLQNKELKQEEKLICDFCNKDFIVKQAYNGHILNCKQKKVYEENNKQKVNDELKDENQKLKEEIQKLKEENEKLKLTIQFKDEQLKNKDNQIIKLEKTNNELMNSPITSVVNNDNRKTQYNIQFNQLFEKLDILNEMNVNKRINVLSNENLIREYDVGKFTSEFTLKLINALKDLTFCTDQSRKIVVIKDENLNSVKMSVEEMLSKCLELGTDSIRNHFTLTEQVVDDRINNSDETLTSEMLDNFESDMKQLKEFILENNVTIDLKDPKNPLKKFAIPFIKTIEQHFKNVTLK